MKHNSFFLLFLFALSDPDFVRVLFSGASSPTQVPIEHIKLFKSFNSIIYSNFDPKNILPLPEISYIHFRCIIEILNDIKTRELSFEQAVSVAYVSCSLECVGDAKVNSILIRNLLSRANIVDEVLKFYKDISLIDCKYSKTAALICFEMLQILCLTSFRKFNLLISENKELDLPIQIWLKENNECNGLYLAENYLKHLYVVFLNANRDVSQVDHNDLSLFCCAFKFSSILTLKKKTSFNTIYIRVFGHINPDISLFGKFIIVCLCKSIAFPDLVILDFYGYDFNDLSLFMLTSLSSIKTMHFELCKFSEEFLYKLFYSKNLLSNIEHIYITNSFFIVDHDEDNLNLAKPYGEIKLNSNILCQFFAIKKDDHIKSNLKTLKINGLYTIGSIILNNLHFQPFNTLITQLELILDQNSIVKILPKIFLVSNLRALSIHLESCSKEFIRIFNLQIKNSNIQKLEIIVNQGILISSHLKLFFLSNLKVLVLEGVIVENFNVSLKNTVYLVLRNVCFIETQLKPPPNLKIVLFASLFCHSKHIFNFLLNTFRLNEFIKVLSIDLDSFNEELYNVFYKFHKCKHLIIQNFKKLHSKNFLPFIEKMGIECLEIITFVNSEIYLNIFNHEKLQCLKRINIINPLNSSTSQNNIFYIKKYCCNIRSVYFKGCKNCKKEDLVVLREIGGIECLYFDILPMMIQTIFEDVNLYEDLYTNDELRLVTSGFQRFRINL